MDDSGNFPHGGQAPPQHWFDTWDNRGNLQTTTSSALSAKGLRNAPGENNCFLNSAVQVSFFFFYSTSDYFL